MPIAHISSVIHLKEDTSKTFDLVPLLKSLGYSPLAVLTITQMSALDANGAPGATVPAG